VWLGFVCLTQARLKFASFFVHDMLTQEWVELPQADPLFGVVAVLLREVAVRAFAADQFNRAASFFTLRHRLLFVCCGGRNLQLVRTLQPVN
jgi:hypothetical protein